MKNLPAALDNVLRIYHAIYGADFTVWCRTGSDVEVEESLQKSANVVSLCQKQGFAMRLGEVYSTNLKNPAGEPSGNIEGHINNQLVHSTKLN